MENIQIAPISTNETSANFNKLYLQKKDSDFVSVRLTSSGFTIGASGIANATNKSALLRLRKEHLNAFLKYAGTSLTDSSNELTKEMPTTLSGVLQVQESFEPFYEGQSAKRKGANGDIILVNGKPVYRNTIFIADVNAPDYLFGSIEVSTNESGKEVRTFVSGLVEEEEVVNTQTTASPAEAFSNVPA